MSYLNETLSPFQCDRNMGNASTPGFVQFPQETVASVLVIIIIIIIIVIVIIVVIATGGRLELLGGTARFD